MTKTVNRKPIEVPVNSQKEYFFNHLKWNGFCSSKNILTVDQETFADCNNVYVNGTNILTSRPPITRYKPSGLDIDNIVNVWAFSNTLVLQHMVGNSYELMFTKNGDIYGTIKCPEYVKPIFVEGKIFIFSESTFGFFDTKSLLYGNMYYENGLKIIEGEDPESYIYIPNTIISTNSIQGKDEYKNELTTGETITYNYSQNSKIDFTELINKTVTLIITGTKYVIDNFVDGNEKVILQPISVAPADVIKASVENETFIAYNKSHNTILYSPDGRMWEILPIIADIVGEPYITNDGASCVVFKTDGFYMYSLAKGVDNLYTFVDDSGVRIWKKFSYGFISGEYLDTEFIPTGEFDTNDIYAFVVRSTIKTYFKLSNHDMALPGATPMPYDISALNLVEVGHITFTRFAGTGTKLVITYTAGSIDAYDNYPFNIAVYNISAEGVIAYSGSSLLTYDGQSLTNVNLNIPVKNTGLKILWDAASADYEILVAGGVGIDVSAADVYWRVSIVNNAIPIGVKATPIVQDLPLRTPCTYFLISNRNNSILTDQYLYSYVDNTLLPLLSFNIGSKPIVNDSYIINSIGKQLYSTDYIVNIPITIMSVEPIVNFKKFYNYVELSQHFLSQGEYLYISEDRRNDKREFLWYLPEINTQQFNYDITGLHILSQKDVGIFFENEIWYVSLVVVTQEKMSAYQYTKSKLQVGVLQGSSIITSDDGKYIMFGTGKGLVTMSYQDFVASTEQTLRYLSDGIQNEWVKFAEQPIKLFADMYWIICYQDGNKDMFVFDMRNGSWWPWSYKGNINNITKFNKDIIVLANNLLYRLGDSSDYSDDGVAIDWYITSQPLHLSAINNYKHVINMTVNSVSDLDGSIPFTYVMDLIVYRNNIVDENRYSMEYIVLASNTYVKRLNFSKVNLFQYSLSNDKDNVKQLQLSLTGIVIKYSVKERVR